MDSETVVYHGFKLKMRWKHTYHMFFVAQSTLASLGIPWHPLEIRLVVSNTRKGNQTMAMEKPQLISADY